jgi:hypothetical protein
MQQGNLYFTDKVLGCIFVHREVCNVLICLFVVVFFRAKCDYEM